MVKKPLGNPYVGAPMNRPELSDFFVGKEFSIVVDGVPEIKFKVSDINTLSWLKNGAGWEEEYYECYESSSKGLYFLFHQVKNDFGLRVRVLAIDTQTHLVTLLAGNLGLEDYTPRDTDANPFFGYIDLYDGAPAPTARHAYTMELIQKNILWSVGDYRLIHYYVNRRYYSRQMLGEENGLVTSERARHIKLRDGVYLFFWRELQGPGILGCDIMDLNEFHGVGLLYGVTDYRFICNGFTRETGRFVTDDELAEFERVFLDSGDQTYALKTVFGVDLPKTANPLLHV
jgi:hypothetical protein